MALPVVKAPSAETRIVVMPPRQGEWTYDDYQQLPDDSFRYEIIKGHLYMAGAPKPIHQQLILNLAFAIMTLLQAGKEKGRVYVSPIEVIMGDWATPVQPDLLFIREEHLDIVAESKIEGVPDLIIEVLSSNWRHDRVVKYEAYAEAGVAEYWIVDPEGQTVETFVLRGHAYALVKQFGLDDQIHSEVLPSFAAKVSDLFV
ncbi:MAG: Uma2 family endonuclease [Anaerolineales bacterium]|nr:Uma2 family endonuclease [Anaerolineales bacterium]